MAWTTLAAIYFIMWWVVLFAVLPWGVSSQHEHGDYPAGTDPGAPAIPGLRTKLVWTTIVTTIVCVGFYAVYASRLVTLEDLATLWGLLR
jgi:predicted secreted protein